MDFFDISNIYDKTRTLQTVTIEVSNQCNWQCKHCYLDKDKTALDINKIFEVIDDARRLGASDLRLSGGEVTIFPQLEQIIIYARKRYMNVTLLSNMSVLSKKVLECIRKYGIEGVEVTLFSHEDSIHDSFVGRPGALQCSLKNISTLKALGIDVLVKTWAIKSNIRDLEKMQEFFLSRGYRFSVDVQIYADVHGIMQLPKEEQLTEAEYCYALHMQDRTRQLPLKKEATDRLCKEFSTSIYITAAGDIVPCAKYRKPLSNVYRESLKNVWESSAALQYVQNLCWADCKECQNCKIQDYCVRCGAMSFIKGHDFLENCEETCILARIRASNYKCIPEGRIY